jgi:hypothetical protein
MSANDAHDVVEAWRIGQMLTHLVTPSALVPFDAVLESVRERVGIDSHHLSFSLEEWSDLGK